MAKQTKPEAEIDIDHWLSKFFRNKETMRTSSAKRAMAFKAVLKYLIANPDIALQHGYRVVDGRLYHRQGAYK